MADGSKLRKRPSRRYRRRPKNLLTEYARRKRRNVWLETHIWHAKRFHMTELWGYKIPKYPNDRGVRAAYRDATTRCVLMDLSYYCCIELTGQQQHIIDSLACISSREIGPTFGAVSCISGTRQGRTVLYHENSYPFGALGEVTFLWQPLSTSSSESDARQLWIWTHPSCYSDIFTELKKVFGLTEDDCRSVPISSSCRIEHSVEEMSQSSRTKRKRKKKSDASCPKRARLGAESVGDVTVAAAEDTIESQNILMTDSKAAEHLTKVPEDNITLPETVSIKVESKGTGEKDGDRIKSKKKVRCGASRLLSKCDLVRNIYENHKVRLESLKDELCRFRLIGPNTHQVIVEALQVADSSCVQTSENSTDDNVDKSQQRSTEVPSRWWDDYVISLQGSAENVHQANTWKQIAAMHNAAELPPFSVHGLTVRDPRLFIPQHRTSSAYSSCEYRECPAVDSVETLMSSSPIWDRAIRDRVQQTMMSIAELNRRRSDCLLPGSVPDLGCQESRVPLLLIQNPGYQSHCALHSTPRQQDAGPGAGFGSGWDLILPAGWSMAFWMSLVYRGAKAVGLREQRSLAFEAGQLTCPDSCPDTPSGAKINLSRAAELRLAYNRRPPAKRCNYDKMGVSMPFHCPWLELVQGWMLNCEVSKDHGLDEESFYCLRNRKLLQSLDVVCAGLAAKPKSSRQNSVPGSSTVSVSTALEQSGLALVQVRIVMMGRGSPGQHALICLPMTEDVLDAPHRRNHHQGIVEDPTEPVHRKPSTNDTKCLTPTSVLGSATRLTIGFIVEGGFSHAAARGCGVGFVSAVGLRKLLEQKPNPESRAVVLVRCIQSLQYRPATLHVVVP